MATVVRRFVRSIAWKAAKVAAVGEPRTSIDWYAINLASIASLPALLVATATQDCRSPGSVDVGVTLIDLQA